MKRNQSWLRRLMTVLAAGGMLTAFSASCDPLTGTFFVDRFDDDDFGCCFDFGLPFDYFFFDAPFLGDVIVQEF